MAFSTMAKKNSVQKRANKIVQLKDSEENSKVIKTIRATLNSIVLPTDLLPPEGNRTQTIWHRDISAAKLILYNGSDINCI